VDLAEECPRRNLRCVKGGDDRGDAERLQVSAFKILGLAGKNDRSEQHDARHAGVLHVKCPPGRSRPPNCPLFWRCFCVLCAGVVQSCRTAEDFFSFFPFFPAASSPSSRRRRPQENARSQAGERAVSSRRTRGLKQARTSSRTTVPNNTLRARTRTGRDRSTPPRRHPHRLGPASAASTPPCTRPKVVVFDKDGDGMAACAAREKPARVSLLAAPMLEQIERVSTACWASRRFSPPLPPPASRSTASRRTWTTRRRPRPRSSRRSCSRTACRRARSLARPAAVRAWAARPRAACESKVDDLERKAREDDGVGAHRQRGAQQRRRLNAPRRQPPPQRSQTRLDQTSPPPKHEIWFW
jgi:hypothetical protein